MPVFNADRYLRDSIESVLSQTFSNFEFIIINDASTDDSATILNSYKDSRIKVFKNDCNLGLTKSLNLAIELSEGKYIARTDADDICLPKRFDTQIQLLEKHSEIGLCGSWYENFGAQSGIAKYNVEHNKIAIGLLFQSQLSHSAVMMRRETLDKFNLRYNIDFVTAQDYDLWSRMIQVCGVTNIPETLMRVRFHTDSVSVKNKEQQFANRNKIITNQFEKMGTTISNREIDLFVKFANSKFDFKIAELNQLELFLERALIANNVSGFVSKLFFTDFISEKWFHVCYNLQDLGFQRYQKYYASKLTAGKKTDWLNRLKFRLHSIL